MGLQCMSGAGRAGLLSLLLASGFAAPVNASTAEGLASYYGPGFHGRRTASGQRFNQHAMTAAHRSMRFGTRVRVTNTRNDRSVVVTITDRGPFVGGRIIDLSKAAAARLGMVRSGVARVRLEVLGKGASSQPTRSRGGAAHEALLRELF